MEAEIEKYPHITWKMNILWGTRAMDDFLFQLVATERINRQGFPSEMIEELIWLQSYHYLLYRFSAKELPPFTY